ncbi:sensor histidine kinase [Paenibacillus sp. D51F]
MKRHSALLLYLRGQLFSLSVVASSLLTGAAIWYLERVMSSAGVDWAVLGYFLLLSLCMTVAGLMLGYLRQRAYLKQLLRMTGQPAGWKPLLSPVTAEQKKTAELISVLGHQSQDRLEQHNRERELHRHFVFQWVHHMKTPVSVIDLIAQNAASKPGLVGQELQDASASLREETDKLARGLEQMMHTARLDEFAMDFHPRRVSLHEAARTAVNAHKRLIIAAGVYPRITGEGWVETDEKWLHFLLGQLVANAVKYSRPKPGSKQLAIAIVSQTGGGTSISVRDEGIGIPAQDIPRVFDPFFTGENGRKTEESTGMGLYLAREVASRMGVGLELESAAGEGTTATLSFHGKAIHEDLQVR